MRFSHLHRRFPPAHRNDAGFALPTAMFFILGMLAILSIGAVAAVNTQRGTVRDSNSKAALAVAESGVDTALLRYREHPDALTEGEPCLTPDFTSTARLTPISFDSDTSPIDGWCPPVEASESQGNFTYWARPYVEGLEQKIDVVSQGTVNGVTRRILQTAEIPPGEPGLSRLLGGENVVGLDFVEMSGNAQIKGGVGSNGNVTMGGSANVCGTVRTGQEPFTHDNSSSRNPPTNCPQGRTSIIGIEDFPPVTLPDGLTPQTSATQRFFTEDGNDLPSWYIGTESQRRERWNPTSRVLKMGSGLTLRLRANSPYLVCQLVLEGGAALSMENPTGPVQIYIDSPENCPGTPTVPFQFADGTRILNNGFVPGIFILGSENSVTSANPAGGAFSNGVVIYAPRTEFVIDNGINMSGAVIAKEITLAGGANLVSIEGINEYELPIPGEPSPGGIIKDHFFECRADAVDPESTSSPDNGCQA